MNNNNLRNIAFSRMFLFNFSPTSTTRPAIDVEEELQKEQQQKGSTTQQAEQPVPVPNLSEHPEEMSIPSGPVSGVPDAHKIPTHVKTSPTPSHSETDSSAEERVLKDEGRWIENRDALDEAVKESFNSAFHQSMPNNNDFRQWWESLRSDKDFSRTFVDATSGNENKNTQKKTDQSNNPPTTTVAPPPPAGTSVENVPQNATQELYINQGATENGIPQRDKITHPERVEEINVPNGIGYDLTEKLRRRDREYIRSLNSEGTEVVSYGGEFYVKQGDDLFPLGFSNPENSQFNGALNVVKKDGKFVANVNNNVKQPRPIQLNAINNGYAFKDDEGSWRRFNSSTGRFELTNDPTFGDKRKSGGRGFIDDKNKKKAKRGPVVPVTKMTPEQVQSDPNLPGWLKSEVVKNSNHQALLNDPDLKQELWNARSNKDKDENSRAAWNKWVSWYYNINPEDKEAIAEGSKRLEADFKGFYGEVSGERIGSSYFQSMIDNETRRINSNPNLTEEQKEAEIQKLKNRLGKTEADAAAAAQRTAMNLTREMWPQKGEGLDSWWNRLDDNQKTGLIAGGGVGLLSFLMMMGQDEKDAMDWILGLGIPLVSVGGGAYFGSAGKADPKAFNKNIYEAYKKKHGM